MNVPAFLFDCLQQELYSLQLTLLEKVATKYDLPLEELQTLIQPTSLDTQSNVYICKKQKGKPIPEIDQRCMARIWNRGKGGQCTRTRLEECQFCCQHKNKQKHGIITDKPPLEVYNKSVKVLYK